MLQVLVSDIRGRTGELSFTVLLHFLPLDHKILKPDFLFEGRWGRSASTECCFLVLFCFVLFYCLHPSCMPGVQLHRSLHSADGHSLDRLCQPGVQTAGPSSPQSPLHLPGHRVSLRILPQGKSVHDELFQRLFCASIYYRLTHCLLSTAIAVLA